MSDSQRISIKQPEPTRTAAGNKSVATSLPAVPLFKELKKEEPDADDRTIQREEIANYQQKAPDTNAPGESTVQRKQDGAHSSLGAFHTKEEKPSGISAANTAKPFESPKVSQPVTGAGAVAQRMIMITGGGRVRYNKFEIDLLEQPEEVKEVLYDWDSRGMKEYATTTQMITSAKAEVTRQRTTYTNAQMGAIVTSLKDPTFIPAALDEDMLLNVLKTAFESNWFKAKSCLVFGEWPWDPATNPFPSHEKSMQLMLALVKMRLKKWELFRNEVTPLAQEKYTDDTIKLLDPDGSISVTSDLDVSVKGKESERAISFLNQHFKTMFGVVYDPGTVFDLNFYALDWMHDLSASIEPGKGAGGGSLATLTPTIEPNLSAEHVRNNAERAKALEVWSYVKIMRNLSPTQITEYKAEMLKNFPKKKEGSPPVQREVDTPERIAMTEKLELATRETLAFKLAISTKVAAMVTELERQRGRVESSFAAGLNNTRTDAAYMREAATMRVSNDLYQAELIKVRTIRQRIETVKNSSDPASADTHNLKQLADLLAESIAKALTFANEVYATEGGVLHTVFGKQKAVKMQTKFSASKKEEERAVTKVKTKLTSDQYMESINENVGDSIHSIHSYLHRPQFGAFRAGKYIERMVEAVELLYEQEREKLGGIAGIPDAANYRDLKIIGEEAAKNKAGALGKDPTLAPELVPFSEYDTGDKLEGLAKTIYKFGAAASGKYKTTA